MRWDNFYGCQDDYVKFLGELRAFGKGVGEGTGGFHIIRQR